MQQKWYSTKAVIVNFKHIQRLDSNNKQSLCAYVLREQFPYHANI